jgi:hypothetical protein
VKNGKWKMKNGRGKRIHREEATGAKKRRD